MYDLASCDRYAIQLYKESRFQEATQVLLHRVLNVGDANSWLDYGQSLAAQEHDEPALAAYRMAEQLGPASARLFSLKARVLASLGRFDEALVAANAGIAIEPSAILLASRAAILKTLSCAGLGHLKPPQSRVTVSTSLGTMTE